MRIYSKFLSIALIFIFILLFEVFFYLKSTGLAEVKSSVEQMKNFNDDLAKANDYWKHNKLGDMYFRNVDYSNAIEEYKTAIKIIENSSDEYTRTDASKVYKEKVNHDLKVSSQIYSRYGLIEALEKAGRYEEALENVEWLSKNQIMKGKEDLLKNKLEGMRQNLLEKICKRK